MFDAASRLILVDIEEGREVYRSEQALEEEELGRRARRVAELGVDLLICGAISRPLETMLSSAGVEVISQICGPVEEVITAFRMGKLSEETYVMPGATRGVAEL